MSDVNAITTTDGAIVRMWRYPSPSENPARVYIASLAPGSRGTMERALEVIAGIAQPKCDIDHLPWHLLRYQHTAAIRAVLAARYDYTTANKMLSALRQVLKSAWRLKLVAADDYMAAADFKNVSGSKPDQAAGHAVESGELRNLVDACNDGTLAGVRDSAMLGVAAAGGLRRAEIASLTVDGVNLATGTVTVRGKRNKIRTVPLPAGAVDALRDWLDVRGTEPGALFLPIGKGDKIKRQQDDGGALVGLTGTGVYTIFQERAQQAKVGAFSPHDLRRTYAGELLDAGVDISTVQRLMGHANVNTTAGYDRRGERAKKKAAGQIYFPYQSRER